MESLFLRSCLAQSVPLRDGSEEFSAGILNAEFVELPGEFLGIESDHEIESCRICRARAARCEPL